MAVVKKNEAKNNIEYNVEVLRVREVNNAYTLDINVNGVTIYGCWYRTYTDKEGNERGFVAFPSHKGNDEKYYNHCWFPMNEKVLESIEKQMNSML